MRHGWRLDQRLNGQATGHPCRSGRMPSGVDSRSERGGQATCWATASTWVSSWTGPAAGSGVLWGSLIITEGPFVNDLVVATLDEFTEVYTPGTGHPAGPDGRPYLADVIRFLDEADLAATLRDLKLGLLVASEHADVPVQPGHDSLAPLAASYSTASPWRDPRNHRQRRRPNGMSWCRRS